MSRDSAYFTVAALLFVAALAVWAFAHNPYFVQVIVWMALNVAYVKIGGQSHPVGPIIGTVVMSFLAQLAIGFGAQDTLLFGSAIVLTMLFMPEGFIGVFDRCFPIRRESASHRRSTAASEMAP